jgi:hypothetical protein
VPGRKARVITDADEVPMKFIAALGISLVAFPAFGQTPPTATEAFNLRIKCKQMADEKAEAMSWHPMSVASGATMNMSPAAVERLNRDTEPYVVLSSNASRYDPKTNRCYIEIHDHTQKKGRDVDIRSVYDGQIDDLLAFAKIENNKKVGMVFDHSHQTTPDNNLGFDNANGYMDRMMEDRR